MKQNEELSLTGLTLPSFDRKRIQETSERISEKIEQYHEKYGDKCWERMLIDEGLMPDYDDRKKSIDTAIYNRTWVSVHGHSEWARTCVTRQIDRMKELFGKNCDVYTVLMETTVDIGDLLLKEALRTGKWKELPDKLQPKYHELVTKK